MIEVPNCSQCRHIAARERKQKWFGDPGEQLPLKWYITLEPCIEPDCICHEFRHHLREKHPEYLAWLELTG